MKASSVGPLALFSFLFIFIFLHYNPISFFTEPPDLSEMLRCESSTDKKCVHKVKDFCLLTFHTNPFFISLGMMTLTLWPYLLSRRSRREQWVQLHSRPADLRHLKSRLVCNSLHRFHHFTSALISELCDYLHTHRFTKKYIGNSELFCSFDPHHKELGFHALSTILY